MIEDHIVQLIKDAWNKDQNHPHRGRQQKSVELRDIKKILDIAFISSITKEEGKTTSFNIILIENVCKRIDNDLNNFGILKFDKYYEFEVDTVVKLSHSLDFECSALIIEPVDRNKENYKIYGVLYFDNNFSIPAVIPDLAFNIPDELMVSVISPGQLLIVRGSGQIGQFKNGDFYKSIPTPFYSKAMGKYLINFIADNELYIKHGNNYWGYYSDYLMYLLLKISNHNNGGIVILIKEDISFYKDIISKYNVKNLKIYERLMEYRFESRIGKDTIFNMLISEKTRRYLEFLSKLASIDGALILNDYFEVISFGAKISTPNWNGNVIIGPDGFNINGEAFDYSNYGMRHRSTINFIGASNNTIGFVISSDGPIRGFVKNNNSILCWPDCRVSMFFRSSTI